jgi:hypothetical protein
MASLLIALPCEAEAKQKLERSALQDRKVTGGLVQDLLRRAFWFR